MTQNLVLRRMGKVVESIMQAYITPMHEIFLIFYESAPCPNSPPTVLMLAMGQYHLTYAVACDLQAGLPSSQSFPIGTKLTALTHWEMSCQCTWSLEKHGL